ncbi:MAG: hypothetical protein H7126_06270 [Candidatus Parcubacteria bacterium]|nr:hypothetical protein [Leptolyngbyaceae cyanobacterium LF-bin-113]
MGFNHTRLWGHSHSKTHLVQMLPFRSWQEMSSPSLPSVLLLPHLPFAPVLDRTKRTQTPA